jgi:hypothetical protein
MWGQWIYGSQISEKFNLNYAGKPSFFEGKTSLPAGFDEVKLQIFAADQAGNFGHHTVSYHVGP